MSNTFTVVGSQANGPINNYKWKWHAKIWFDYRKCVSRIINCVFPFENDNNLLSIRLSRTKLMQGNLIEKERTNGTTFFYGIFLSLSPSLHFNTNHLPIFHKHTDIFVCICVNTINCILMIWIMHGRNGLLFLRAQSHRNILHIFTLKKRIDETMWAQRIEKKNTHK